MTHFLTSFLLGIASIFGFQQSPIEYTPTPAPIVEQAPAQTLGSVNEVSGITYYLYGSGVGSTDTSVTLTSFKQPVNSYPLLIADFGDIGYLTLEPGNTTRQEFVSFTGVTQNTDGTATLTGVTRGLSPVSPYTASTTIRKAHGGGTTAVISNPPQFYQRFTKKDSNETITGQWTFSVFPITPSSPAASETTAGIVELATGAEAAASTLSGTLGRLALSTAIATSTSNANTKANVVPVTNGSGVIDPKFVFGQNITLPSSGGVASTTLSNDGNGSLSWQAYSKMLPGIVALPASAAAASTTIVSSVIPPNMLGKSDVLHGKVIAAWYPNGSANRFALSFGGLATTTISSTGGYATTTLDFYIQNNGTATGQSTAIVASNSFFDNNYATSTTAIDTTATTSLQAVVASTGAGSPVKVYSVLMEILRQ